MPTERRPDKAVPLVIYKGGECIVLGSAYLKGDGRIEGQIAKDVKKELQDLLFGDRVGNISINPEPPPIHNPALLTAHTSTFVDTKANEPVEVAVIPPLKIKDP